MKYIRDGKIVRKCDRNLKQMNTFEYMYYEIFHWNYFQKVLKFILEKLTNIIYDLLVLLLNIILFIFTPITLFIVAKKELKEAKRR